MHNLCYIELVKIQRGSWYPRLADPKGARVVLDSKVFKTRNELVADLDTYWTTEDNIIRGQALSRNSYVFFLKE